MTVVASFKVLNIFAQSNIIIVGSNVIQDMNICLCGSV